MNQYNLFQPGHGKSPDILKSIRNFSEFGQATIAEKHNNTTYFLNEFWTSRQRQAHRIHEISYRACFKPQLPEFFIRRLTDPGEIVYDPFMGRGTTLVEAAIHGRIPYGNDINPLSRAFTEPRINPPQITEVNNRLQQIPWGDFKEVEHVDLLAFYHPETLAKLEGLRNYLIDRESRNEADMIDAWIRMVAINRLTGHSSGFFSVYTLPPNQAVSVERQRKINKKRQQTPPPRNIPQLIAKKTRSLLSAPPLSAQRYLILTEPSCSTPQIESGSVALTVTSPPFLSVVNYEYDNWLRCWFIGVDSKSVSISQHTKVEQWEKFIGKTLAELARVTRKGGHIAFEVGEVKSGTILLEKHVMAAAKGLPLKVLGVMINQQKFTKTANCWGILNNTTGTNSNRIVLFKRV